MKIDSNSLASAFCGFKTVYSASFEAAEGHADKVSMSVSSQALEEEYGWLGNFPEMREWLAERRIKQLSKHGFTIRNKKFESTISVSRDDMADDKLGLYRPMFSEMGRSAKLHKDQLVFRLLKTGFDTTCFDGQNFFDADHPVEVDGTDTSVSNMQAGTGPAWFLLDTTREIRPIIWQEREGYEFQAVDSAGDQSVFLTDTYLYGIRARVNAGFGLWQLAFGSKADLTPVNYEAARAAMMAAQSSDGQLLDVKPNVLVVPPALEGAARSLLMSDQISGSSNIWRDSAEMIVSFDVGGSRCLSVLIQLKLRVLHTLWTRKPNGSAYICSPTERCTRVMAGCSFWMMPSTLLTPHSKR